MIQRLLRLALTLIAILPVLAVLISGCANDRKLKPVLSNSARIPKSALKGEFYFLKSVVEIRSPGVKFSNLLPGAFLKTNQLIRFDVKEKTLDAVSTVTVLQTRRPAERTPIAMSVAVRNVDVLRKQNADGQDTHEEEETENRHAWSEREFVVFDGATDAQDELKADTLSATMENVQVEPGSIRFDVSRQLSDGTLALERYHFLAKTAGRGFVPKPYPVDLQNRFGFFKTVQVGYDLYAQPSQADSTEWMNLRNVQKNVRYLVDPSFPDHLKGGVRSSLDQWNVAFRNSTERAPLEVAFESTADKAGDLRYNVIIFDDTPGTSHGILGYAPTFTDPTNGEIVKGDVFLYGGTLAWARLADESWRRAAESRGPISRAPELTTERKSNESQAVLQALRPYRALPFTVPRIEAPELAATVRKHATPMKLLENSQKEFRGEFAERVTRWEAGQSTVSAFGSDSTVMLEQKIFLPLMAHEIGHTLGLRHNFKGSADHRHHNLAKGSKSSTVMDYGFLASQETPDIGQYDSAAIEIGYGSRRAEQKRLRQENFFFCSDDQLFNTKDGLCLPYDSGVSLTEIVETLFTRYIGTYHFLNLRLDRLYYDESMENYLSKVGSLLLPIRQIYDHAAAIVNAFETKNFLGIWRLAGSRIEADPSSENIVDLAALAAKETAGGKDLDSVPTPVLRIDRDKLHGIVEDARQAKRAAVRVLYQIVFKRNLAAQESPAKLLSLRPDVDQTDDANNALWQRGVLPDRLMALGLLLSASPDPLGITKDRSIAVTFAEGLPAAQKPEFKDRLLQLLSHSALEGDTWMPLSPALPTVVRRSALEWLRQDPGYYSEGSLRKLIAVQRMPLERGNLSALSLLSFRFDEIGPVIDDPARRDIDWITANLADLIRASKSVTKEREKEVATALAVMDRRIANATGVSLLIPSTRETLTASLESTALPSASFVHMNTHLFRAELFKTVNEKIVSATAKEIAAEESKETFEYDRILLFQLRSQHEEAAYNVELLTNYLSAERELLEKMNAVFNGLDPLNAH